MDSLVNAVAFIVLALAIIVLAAKCLPKRGK
jgi:hypothetical protein